MVLRIDSATLTLYCSEQLLSYRIDNFIAIVAKIVQIHPLHAGTVNVALWLQ